MAYDYACAYPPCGWQGNAQTARPGRVEGNASGTWAENPWCPRCGADGTPGMPRPVAWTAEAVLIDGLDVPDGTQPKEVLADTEDGATVHEHLPARALRWLRKQVDRINDLVTRVTELEKIRTATATVLDGQTSVLVEVAPAWDGRRVLATLNTQQAANVAVRSAIWDGNGNVTVRLTVAATGDVVVSLLVDGRDPNP